MFLSCDTPSTSFEGNIETFENITSAELESQLSSLSAGKAGYNCSVSTWDMPGSEKQNSHTNAIHYFPEDLVKQARGKTRTWTFVLTHSSVAATYRYKEYENVAQIAHCNLPDVEGIEEIMTDRLLIINPAAGDTKFISTDNQGTWQVHASPEKSASIPENNPRNPDITTPLSAPCSNGVYCSQFFITIATVGEVVISIYVECIGWTYYSSYCEGGGGIPYYPPGDPGGPADPGGGGGSPPGGEAPPGGDGSSVDDPCYVDPNEPPQAQPVECLNDPCDWLAPPVGWMCGNTCQTNDALIDDINVQVAMHEAWLASYGSDMNPLPHNHRNEVMYMVTVTSSGYDVTEIPPGPNTSSCHFDGGNHNVPTNTVALIHTHPYSHDDVLEDPRCPSGSYDAQTVSNGDKALMQALINGGFNIPIYVIDKDKIRVIQPSNPSQYAQTINRCGY